MNHKQLKCELESGNYTCIAFDENGLYYSSYKQGIVPLAELCEKNTACRKLYIGDKVTGKAAALLTVKCGAQMLYTGVITNDALDVLIEHGIDIEYEKKVPHIKNRTGTGKCPMELLAKDVVFPAEMYDMIKAFLEK